MTSISNKFVDRFGPWAIIAGASEGLGAALTKEAAKRGLNVVLIARREEKLQALAGEIEEEFSVATKIIPYDLTNKDLYEEMAKQTQDIEIGLVIYNAALSPIGLFHHFPIEKHLQVIDLNCRGPMIFTHLFGKQMKERKKGGIILMSSLAGFQGAPVHAHYGATKAYNLSLAEALWDELREDNVRVVACVAGATSTPNFKKSQPKKSGLIKAPIMEPEKVARIAFKGLRRNKPYIITGCTNAFGHFMMRHFMSRKQAVKFMGKVGRNMYGEDKDHINK